MSIKKNIALVAGGFSSEKIISLNSVKAVDKIIDKEKYNIFKVLIDENEWWVETDTKIPVNKDNFSFLYNNHKVNFDFVLMLIHGIPGEDGTLSAYFDLLNIPYSNCNVNTSSITFNKFICNSFLKNYDIPIAPSLLLIDKKDHNMDMINEKIGIPCFVKPNAGGSSFGTSKVIEKEDLPQAIESAFRESNQVIVEQFIQGTEVSCGVVKFKDKEYVFPITEIVSNNDFFDFDAKYNSQNVREITPARIAKDLENKIKTLSSQIYDFLQCKGIVRIDYIISGTVPYFLEVNTVPGMTENSLIPQQVEAMGLSLKKLLTKIIEENVT